MEGEGKRKVNLRESDGGGGGAERGTGPNGQIGDCPSTCALPHPTIVVHFPATLMPPNFPKYSTSYCVGKKRKKMMKNIERKIKKV